MDGLQGRLADLGAPNIDAEIVKLAPRSEVQSHGSNASSTCQRIFHHWCLNSTTLSAPQVAGIITGGVLILVIVLALIGWGAFCLTRRRPHQGMGHLLMQTRSEAPQRGGIKFTDASRMRLAFAEVGAEHLGSHHCGLWSEICTPSSLCRGCDTISNSGATSAGCCSAICNAYKLDTLCSILTICSKMPFAAKSALPMQC